MHCSFELLRHREWQHIVVLLALFLSLEKSLDVPSVKTRLWLETHIQKGKDERKVHYITHKVYEHTDENSCPAL